jgi:thiol-disulfide isomerase/thioredoxin
MTKELTAVASLLSVFLALAGNLPSARADSGLGVGDNAPCISLRDVQPDGHELDQCIRSRPDHVKYILVEFFSITCSACLDNMPVVAQLARDLGGNAATRLIAIDRDEAAIRQYIAETPADLKPFPIALDTKREAKKAFGIYATPTLFILNSTNQIVYKHIGTLSPDDVEAIKTQVIR